VIVAIDAVDYTQKLSWSQFRPELIHREIKKAVTGIRGTSTLVDPSMPVCTGRWGCGVFKGDLYLKFLIQCVACTLTHREMVYKAQDETERKELEVMSNFYRDW
jgi:poly(ADP-ribose) glycohydrolase